MARRAETTERAPETWKEPPVWQIGSAGLLSGVRLGLRSAWRGWRQLSAVALGMIITVTLLSVAPIYTTLVSNTQIAAELASAPSTDRNLEVAARVAPFWQGNLDGLDSVMTDVRRQSFPPNLFSATTEYIECDQTFNMAKVNGYGIGSKQAQALLPGYPGGGQLDLLTYSYTDAAPHMTLYAGRLPQPTPHGAPPEVAVTPKLNAKPGELLTIADGVNTKRTLVVKVVGVWYPKDEFDPFWNGRGFQTVFPTPPATTPPPVFPVLFDRAAFEQTLSFKPASPGEPAIGLTAHYVWFVNASAVTADNVSEIATDVKELRNGLNGNVLGAGGVRGVSLTTRLGDILSQGQTLFGLLRLPLYSVAAQLALMALLFVMTMAGMLIESQGGVIATLRSRGASMTQMLVGYIAQGAGLAALALVVGPLLAMALGLFVIITFVPASHIAGFTLTPEAVLREAPWRQALQPALLGAGLGLLAVIVSAWQASRTDVLAYRRRQGRMDRPPFWQRYYLDLALAALVIAGYLQLASFGALGTRALLASVGAASGFDLVQTLTPALTMVVGALLILRASPWLLRLGAWIAGRGRRATGMLAFSQLARASGMFNRLTLLLALSVGVGLFALTFQTTVARSSLDEAYYLTGADERVVIKPEEEGTQTTEPYRAAFAKMPGVRAVTPLYRSYGLTSSDLDSQNVDMVGVDPGDFARVAAWRPDYAAQSLPALMAALKGSEQGKSAGDTEHPMGALVNSTLAQALSLHVGSKFALAPRESLTSHPIQFIVVGMIADFPTMYNNYPDGYMVTDINDYLAALANPYLAGYPINGPNEFLLTTTPDAKAAAARATALTDPNFYVDSTLDARQLAAAYQSDPLAAGMTGLLLAGTALAALMALVALVSQAGMAARQRATQFAVLRTLGMGDSQLLRMLLSEQTVIYITGALGGIALSALLAAAALPFLAFSSASYQPPELGVPAPRLAVNLNGSVVFLLALFAMFALALAIAGLVARSSGLGQALRVGED
ncbi:MAG TPA: FtsX-like permease family protein [Ktedonobacterales bacterium]|nr:FtsX-like permease family protein [Ktedonobacterales bacterium]